MTTERKNGKGFIFSNAIDLSQWDYPRIEFAWDDAVNKFEKDLEEGIERIVREFSDQIGSAEQKIREVAAESLQIVFEKNLSAHFWRIRDQPAIIEIVFSDFAEDGYTVELDLKEAISRAVDDLNSGSFYDTETAIKFAAMLREFADKIEANKED